MEKERTASKGRKDERAKKRYLWAWRTIVPRVASWLRRNFDFEYDEINTENVPGAALIATNHASIYDFMFVCVAGMQKPMAFICSEHVLRVKPQGPLLAIIADLIPHKKGGSGSRTAVKALEKLSEGKCVYLAVEGEQTWDGLPLEIKPGTGKLAKKSGASLVTYRLEGSFLARPRWAKNLRHGKVAGKLINVYTPEMLEGMSSEEVDEAIVRDLYFDIWEWQKTEPSGPHHYKCSKGGFPDGLDKSVSACPACRRIGRLRAGGDEIACECGFKTRMTDTGFFESGGPFESLADWDKFDRELIGELLETARPEDGTSGVIFGDSAYVDLYLIEKEHKDEKIASGMLSLEYRGSGIADDEEGRFVLRLADKEFALDELVGMCMIQTERILFHRDKEYYEIRSDEINLRKYLTAWTLNKERTQGDK